MTIFSVLDLEERRMKQHWEYKQTLWMTMQEYYRIHPEEFQYA